MASVKKGITVASPEWWKHLKWCKRVFWKRQRKADKRWLSEEGSTLTLRTQSRASDVEWSVR